LGATEQNMFVVTPVFKGATINKKMRLDHDSLSRPETRILRWFGYYNQLVHTHHNSQTQGLLNRIVQMYGENHQDRSAMISLAVSELTIRLLRHQTRDFMLSFCQQQPDNNGLTATVAYIEKNLGESLDIDALARIACMGRTKFFNEFRLHFGCSPAIFQQQLRLKKAALLIKQGQQITLTCFELGFNNASHFSRCFKQFYGLTPRQYKYRHLIN